ncbi:putative sulfate/molybdate transporter [Opitutus sp. GAS368]|uniref:putative sulfate/molybdate transporter n=1 Tax=Opitutus sp. GAS368 TaxID=1882749 RepID=UPI000879C03C|nr:putative sulfate/molybdate transporter [Opitutus sp. GAS368]SDS19767.1 Molybdate transporter of MFS superfamily protein [Opitutus sp. GAS368]
MSLNLQFNRRELAGAFGDIGTSLPIIVAMLLASNLNGAGVLVAFGLAQIATGLLYGLPMPVQPLKAMAVVVIAGQAPGGLLQLAGLMIGVLMLGLSASGALDWLNRVIPLCVVRGVQAGLGLSLARTATGLVAREGGAWGWIAAIAALVVLGLMRKHPRLPGALLVVGATLVWAAVYRVDWGAVGSGLGVVVPRPAPWPWDRWAAALTLLVLPQLPLSLSNSLFATQQTVRDLFPGRAFTLRTIGLTYAGLNLLAPWLGGIPVCHGCGGLAGYYALGARTGGAVVIYGALWVVTGLFASGAFVTLAHAFPPAILGAVLLFEAAVLVLLLRDQRTAPAGLALAAVVALLCCFAPQGYLTGLVVGVAGYYALRAAGVRFPVVLA